MWSPQYGADKDVEPPNVERIGMLRLQFGTFVSIFIAKVSNVEPPSPLQNVFFSEFHCESPQCGAPNVE